MHVIYNAGSIRRWAQFSGDFDPIHFDVERAKEMGEDDLIVHDMLPQLHLQQVLTSAMHGIAMRAVGAKRNDRINVRWPTMKTSFRSPVVKDRLHVLDATIDQVHGHFDLRSSHGAGQTLCGVLFASVFKPCGSNSPQSRCGLPAEFCIDAQRLATRLQQFKQSVPDIAVLWVALSALTFAEFLSAKIPLYVMRETNGEAAPCGGAEAAPVITVLTSYTIAVEPDFARKTMLEASSIQGVRCPLHPPTIAYGTGADFSGRFPFDVALNDKTVMQAEVGLLLRAGDRHARGVDSLPRSGRLSTN